jgi:hypothetical protein
MTWIDPKSIAQDPPVSQAQRKAMWAAASGKSTLGIPQSVGKEFANADPGGHLPGKAKDMEKSEKRGLIKGLLKFFAEEFKEPDHNKEVEDDFDSAFDEPFEKKEFEEHKRPEPKPERYDEKDDWDPKAALEARNLNATGKHAVTATCENGQQERTLHPTEDEGWNKYQEHKLNNDV